MQCILAKLICCYGGEGESFVLAVSENYITNAVQLLGYI